MPQTKDKEHLEMRVLELEECPYWLSNTKTWLLEATMTNKLQRVAGLVTPMTDTSFFEGIELSRWIAILLWNFTDATLQPFFPTDNGHTNSLWNTSTEQELLAEITNVESQRLVKVAFPQPRKVE